MAYNRTVLAGCQKIVGKVTLPLGGSRKLQEQATTSNLKNQNETNRATMKNKIAALLLLAVLAWTAPRAARADVIFYDGFNYPNGEITNNFNNTVWNVFSGNGVHDSLVINHQLQVSTTGNTIAGASRADDFGRYFSLTNNSPYTNGVQALYASFTVICTNLPNGPGSYFASFYSSSSGYSGRIFAQTNTTTLPNTWRLGIAGNTTSDQVYPVDLALNTAYQVVVEMDPGVVAPGVFAAASIWVNPISTTQTGYAPVDPVTSSKDSLGFATTKAFNQFAFRQASSFGNGFWLVTNLCVATTFAEAATNVWATNAVAPVIVYQPVGTTNYVGVSSVSLSAVANGQGLPSLTYTWRKNGVAVTNPNGNSSTLTLNSPAVSDSGNYTLVATTPYGLSATSAVAKVSISVAPVPPTITSQPATNTLIYAGQNVVFSVAAIGPGTITYQWNSNNVPILGANGTSLELDSAATNFSAKYTVGVTNEYGGVLSSNLYLQVVNPPVVSIGYLRTLVDPTTYAPTNVPPNIPYQVTGIITTYTNITSGNTASYYLQDGTGGINIFATFGSTFRPALGDVVTFTGVLSSFSSGTELYADSFASDAASPYPYTSYSVLSNNIAALPAPVVIPFSITNNANYVNYTLGASLVKLTNVFFGTNAGNTISSTANQNITVTNSAGQTFGLSFFYYDLDTAGQTLPAFATSVTGVLYGSNPKFTLAVTRFSDIVSPVPVIPLTLDTTTGVPILSWTDSAYVLATSTNVSGPYVPVDGATSPYTIPTTNSLGFYILTK